jgi:hypothetical protein
MASPAMNDQTAVETPPVIARPKRRWLRRVLIGVGATTATLAVAAGLLYSFGGMETPDAATRDAYATMVASGEVPAVQERFTIPIPGCRCHSTEPVLTMQHSTRRIGECSNCHRR